ncbi:peptidoglycan-binding protein [Gilliamella sp. ESL0441]|uniref:peptidoglycan-binding domain-containing protein n=1 Tax=Gilliamella sp. ESL0441 TaxID=2704654 RepID=UPI001C6A73FD|nr:peptidoglycan-binding domain-containing protein [Gilliamella sp. ESL0441]QYN43375.1 peptidoglycan-binding protein [Gilliamella sp. ESL0441]
MWKKGNINGMSEENFEEKRRQQKIFITKELDELCIAKENKLVKTNWQVEKEQRIKPSLWWKEVAKAQASQTESGSQTDTNTPKPTNLSTDGKAWFIHPVAMVDYFVGNDVLFRKGDKDEIIREINIRLAGFGGNVPTDEFTERTENMIKQFQRDYMKVEETGVVDIPVIEAIDKFQEEYAISANVWSQLKCKCSPNKCSGFGNGLGKNTSPERSNTYEYPGIHRSLLFGLCGLSFYLGRQDVYKFRLISSGYRCSQHSEGKITTNHRGKAIDIQFYKENWAIAGKNKKNIEPLIYIRDNFFKTYLNSQDDWKDKNLFTTEPIGLDSKGNSISGFTYSWIHMDVRSFEKQYLLDEYFCTNATILNGEKLITIIKKEVK